MRTRYSTIRMLSAFRAPFSQTRPAVNDQNAQSSQSTCKATSTTVTVTRLKMRLKNLTIGNLNMWYPSPAAHGDF